MTEADPGASPAAYDIDWEVLRRRAVELMERAYAPYSDFPVGVAGLVDDGRVVAGCNVENASYGVGLCAECGMVSDLHATGGGRLVAVYCVGGMVSRSCHAAAAGSCSGRTAGRSACS